MYCNRSLNFNDDNLDNEGAVDDGTFCHYSDRSDDDQDMKRMRTNDAIGGVDFPQIISGKYCHNSSC
jgi:hypothetical protein